MITEHREPLRDTQGRFLEDFTYGEPRWPVAIRIAVIALLSAAGWFAILAGPVILFACLKRHG